LIYADCRDWRRFAEFPVREEGMSRGRIDRSLSATVNALNTGK
jgi:hypothetical protein